MTDTKPTPAEFRELVAQALESGEYEQGIGYLNADGRYCCLGVACELYQRLVGGLNVVTVVRGDPEHDAEDFDHTLTFYDDYHNILPKRVRDALGFSSSLGWFATRQYLLKVSGYSIGELNDFGATFQELAMLFRDPPPGLLVEDGK